MLSQTINRTGKYKSSRTGTDINREDLDQACESKSEYDLDYEAMDSILPCLGEYKAPDAKSGVVFRDCLIDYTACSVKNCIRNLV